MYIAVVLARSLFPEDAEARADRAKRVSAPLGSFR